MYSFNTRLHTLSSMRISHIGFAVLKDGITGIIYSSCRGSWRHISEMYMSVDCGSALYMYEVSDQAVCPWTASVECDAPFTLLQVSLQSKNSRITSQKLNVKRPRFSATRKGMQRETSAGKRFFAET
jgi:hypothetical protein